jgi:molybdenum cofactor synthesis domain-containing protein
MSRGRPFQALLSYDEAMAKVLERTVPVQETETVPLREAHTRVLAEDLEAAMDVPPFGRSAMDGYAVRAADTYGASDLEPVLLKAVGTVHAGDVSTVPVGEGECVYTATGAMTPQGADAEVMIEYTEETDDGVAVRKPVHPGENISVQGSDIRKGSVPLKAGMELGASRIGAAAALGTSHLEVFRRPRVAIFGTGNEVRPIGSTLGPGQVFDVNTYTISVVVEQAGGETTLVDLVGDSKEDLMAALLGGIEVADIVVFTGGSSVGERDLLVDVLGEWGEMLFHGVQVKPGKPVLAAVRDGHIGFGLPGYPTSCLSSGALFLEPVLAKMGRRSKVPAPMVEAEMGRRVVSTIGRTQIMTVKLVDGIAQPAFKGSGAITSMAEADGYLIIPANVDLIEGGQRVDVFLL